MAQMPYTAYRFPRPRTPTEEEFDGMKIVLLITPEADLSPRYSYFKEFKWSLIIVGTLLAVGVGGWCYGQASNDTNTGNSIAIAAAMLGFFPSMPLLLSSASYARMRMDCSEYYEELKRDLKKTDSYAEFRRLRESKEATNLYR